MKINIDFLAHQSHRTELFKFVYTNQPVSPLDVAQAQEIPAKDRVWCLLTCNILTDRQLQYLAVHVAERFSPYAGESCVRNAIAAGWDYLYKEGSLAGAFKFKDAVADFYENGHTRGIVTDTTFITLQMLQTLSNASNLSARECTLRALDCAADAMGNPFGYNTSIYVSNKDEINSERAWQLDKIMDCLRGLYK